jgi:L-rhamnose-H+ transport protein
MGESKLGNGASSWILHMAFIILVANMWGILLKEWKEVSRKTKMIITIGIITIIASVLLVGRGNQLHQSELKKKENGVTAASGYDQSRQVR